MKAIIVVLILFLSACNSSSADDSQNYTDWQTLQTFGEVGKEFTYQGEEFVVFEYSQYDYYWDEKATLIAKYKNNQGVKHFYIEDLPALQEENPATLTMVGTAIYNDGVWTCESNQ